MARDILEVLAEVSAAGCLLELFARPDHARERVIESILELRMSEHILVAARSMMRHLHGHVEGRGSHGELGLQEVSGLLDGSLNKEPELSHRRVGLL